MMMLNKTSFQFPGVEGCQKFEVKSPIRTWLTSDTHFNHKNIVKYEPEARPFADRAEMDEALIGRWNAVVGKDDEVFHLGDFALASLNRIAGYVSRLNGRIWLLLGNHDRDTHGLLERAESLGFAGAVNGFILLDGKYILSHEPLLTTDIPDGYVNLFGHVHGHSSYQTVGENSACMCVERNHCTPFNFAEVDGWFR